MDRPFLRLAPFKIEIMRFNPLAVLFKNVINDEEIERIQELARPKVIDWERKEGNRGWTEGDGRKG